MNTALAIYTLTLVGLCAVSAGVAVGVWWLGEWVKRAILRRMWRKHWGGDDD